ncbi:MAG: D-2-hydroxyacid dehydrogenase family protein [Gammaproteobacteria bacterium]|nr:D-2-hydroxyacid dehydrogenase family protein [Gammaproteobacteria bacterium]
MKRLRCAILDDYQHAALTSADWSVISDAVDVDAYHEHFATEESLVRTLVDHDIVVAMRERTPFPASTLQQLRNLKLLITTGMHNAAIDVETAREHGIMVCGTGSQSAPPAELTFALILGLARHLAVENDSFHNNGPWQQSVGTDLFGKTIGLLGLGKIGGQVARVANAFGMRVVAWSENLTESRAEEVGAIRLNQMDDVLCESDFVSIHLRLSERTRGLLGEKELRAMKSSAYLINTSRGAIVEENALILALEHGWIAGAGLDVFESEPLPQNHVLRTLNNVLATPHLGYVTDSNYRIYYQDAIEDIQAFLAGTPIRRVDE